MSSNLKARSIPLRQGEKSLRDRVPIRFNDWSTIRMNQLEDVPKTAIVKFSLLTHNHGVGGTGAKSSSSFGTRSVMKIGSIEDNPREVIMGWQFIFKEMLPAMIDVDPITAVELFMAHLTGTASSEYEQILYEAAGELYDKYISVDFNRRLTKFGTVDFVNAQKPLDEINAITEESEKLAALEIKAWVSRNERRVEGRKNIRGVTPYSYATHPKPFPKPPGKPANGKFAGWNHEGVSVMSPCAWLRTHNHGWEYAETFFELVFEKVQRLAFKSYGKQAGRTQIEYLTEDLRFDPNHNLKGFFRLVHAHSEAQPYYPTIQHDTEVGRPFSSPRKIQITWNACHEVFHKELVNLNLNRLDDFGGDYELCKTKFLLAEQHFQAKSPSKSSKQEDDNDSGKGKGKGKNKKKSAQEKEPKSNPKVTCDYCGGNHVRMNCFKDPAGPNFRGTGGPAKPGKGGTNTRGNPSFKRGKEANLMAFDEWATQDAEKRARYVEYCQSQGVDVDLNTMEEI